MFFTMKLPVLKCKRPGCGHTWIPRRPEPPKVCPKCKQPDWNKARKTTTAQKEVVA
jgi:hypothetical protein